MGSRRIGTACCGVALVWFVLAGGCGGSTAVGGDDGGPGGSSSGSSSGAGSGGNSGSSSGSSGGSSGSSSGGSSSSGASGSSGASSSGGVDAGLCGPCPANETCCTAQGSLDYGKCYDAACLACCMGGGGSSSGGSSGSSSGSPDAGSDGGLCGPCQGKDVCCTVAKSPDYGKCYNPACLACCM